MSSRTLIHPTALVDPTATVGDGTKIWAFVVVEAAATLGRACVVGTHTFIGKGAQIGEGTRIMGLCYIPTKIQIGRNVFIGPLTSFTGDRYPKVNKPGHVEDPVVIEDLVNVGSNVVVLPGVRLGQGCTVGAGSVVTHDVPPGATVVGNPARVR